MKEFFRNAQAKLTQQLADTDLADRMRPSVAVKLMAGIAMSAALLGGAPDAHAGGKYTANQTLAIAAGSFIAGAVVNQVVNNANQPPPPPVQRVVVVQQPPPQVVYRVVQPPQVQYVAPPPPPPVVQYVAPPPMVVSPQPGQTVVVRPAGGGAPTSVPGQGFSGGGYDNPPPGYQPNASGFQPNGYAGPNAAAPAFNVPLPHSTANLPPYPVDGFMKASLRGPGNAPVVYTPEGAGFDGVVAATMVRNNIGVAVPGDMPLRNDPIRTKQLESAELRVMSDLVNYRKLTANAGGGDYSPDGVRNNGLLLQARAVLETDIVRWTEVRNKLAVQGYNVSVSDVRIRMASESLDELPQYKDPRKNTRTAAYAP